ncbi:sensor histidine kinase [Falsiroseomonas tokyonensis]|uniref:histidine kinase n=1 Tax=Falsiroseomonas tokyonensis TaxID=430521 RepID=A0ABV7BX20_9PROT|nr:HAMP domain-containing sensor histidine kinase [Falsiroseomonas tokyonensis]MBU8538949.1 HAMP domain-containing histidine kinase [Falsiroseomonas tokyonensis]
MNPGLAQLPLIGLLRSASGRFALFFTALFAASATAAAVVLWWNTAGALDRQTDAAIRADATALSERRVDAGPGALVPAIVDRLALDVQNEALYLLLAPDGRVLAGNLEAWPAEANGDAPWIRMPLLRDGLESEARLLRVELGEGYRLLVGRDVAEKLRLRALLSEGLAWAAASSALIAVLGAWLLRRALEDRLAPVYGTAAAISGGDLSRRVPLSDRQDEFDRLGMTMNAMLDRIAQLMEGVRGVSDAIAHDLRTPIARARAKLEESLDSAADEEALRAAVEQGIADLDDIARVFKAVLRIAEVEAGARRAAFAPLDLAPMLADAAELYGAAAEAGEQVLEAALPEALPLVGDRDLLLQAVANLLDNALKFNPPGGRVVLGAHQVGSVVEIWVADDGPGLAPADRARVGERFFRADAARTTPGSGLGLSLVRAVVGLHAGEVVLADSHPGAAPPGLRVTLRLPTSPQPAGMVPGLAAGLPMGLPAA